MTVQAALFIGFFEKIINQPVLLEVTILFFGVESGHETGAGVAAKVVTSLHTGAHENLFIR